MVLQQAQLLAYLTHVEPRVKHRVEVFGCCWILNHTLKGYWQQCHLSHELSSKAFLECFGEYPKELRNNLLYSMINAYAEQARG
tara:strand:+ start:1402 stop:1653 length:252 start_codon:yes stop_codon:yes gene_type:complete